MHRLSRSHVSRFCGLACIIKNRHGKEIAEPQIKTPNLPTSQCSTLTGSQELWVETERKRLEIQVAEIILVHSVSELTLMGRKRSWRNCSSLICEGVSSDAQAPDQEAFRMSLCEDVSGEFHQQYHDSPYSICCGNTSGYSAGHSTGHSWEEACPLKPLSRNLVWRRKRHSNELSWMQRGAHRECLCSGSRILCYTPVFVLSTWIQIALNAAKSLEGFKLSSSVGE